MARGRSKQYWMCGVCALAISWGAYGTPVMAADFTIPSGTTETTPQTLASGEIGVIESGGTLSTSTAATPAILGANNNEITNDGTLAVNAADAAAIVINNGGTITNNGDVSVNGVNSIGILFNDNTTMTNSGTISIMDPLSGPAIIGNSNNTITSSGSISVVGIGAPAIFLNENNTLNISGDVTAANGLGVSFVGGNTIDISGTITSGGDFNGGLFGSSDNTINVSGSISTTGDFSRGIDVLSNNTISYSGTLTTIGDFSDGLTFDSNNTVDVSGTISTGGDLAFGAFFNDDNTINVSGTITTTGDGADGLGGDNRNTITNAGAINVSGADADGIEVNDDSFVTNAGRITASGTGSSDAIEVDDNSRVINSGIAVATGSPIGNGIDAEDNAQIFNTGVVDSSLGAGIDLTSDAVGSFVANNGFIGGNGTSIDFGPGADSLFIANGSILDGIVDFDAGTSAIFFQTGNQTITSTGTTPTVTSAADVFFVQNGATVTSLDQDLLGISELNYAFLDQSHRIHRAISNHVGADTLSQIAARSQEVQVASNDDSVHGDDRGGKAFWASFYGGFAERDDDSQIPDSRHEFWGGIAGARLKEHEGASLGLFGGFGSSRIDSNNERTTAEVDRFFGGLYSAFPMGRWAMTTNVFGGAAQTDSVRNIANNTSPGGLDAARADIDSFFVGAGFETARVFDRALGDFGLRPSGGIRYAGEWSDGYTETGALAALTVSDRTAHAMSGFAELALVNTYDHVQVDFGLGAEGRAIFGDDSVNVTLLATPFTVTPEDNDGSVDGYARLGLKGSVTERLSLFLDLEGRTGSDVDVGAAAQTGLNLLF